MTYENPIIDEVVLSHPIKFNAHKSELAFDALYNQAYICCSCDKNAVGIKFFCTRMVPYFHILYVVQVTSNRCETIVHSKK